MAASFSLFLIFTLSTSGLSLPALEKRRRGFPFHVSHVGFGEDTSSPLCSGGSGAILPNLAARSLVHRRRRRRRPVAVRCRLFVPSVHRSSPSLSLLRPALRPPPLSCRRRAAAIEFCNDSGGVGVRGGAHVRIVRSHEEQERRGRERKGRGAAETDRLKE